MNQTAMTDALRQAIDYEGVGIINNQARLKAYLSDFLPGNGRKFERKLLLDALELDDWHMLLDVHSRDTSEHVRAIRVLLPQCLNDLGWTKERAVLVLECYTGALGWNDGAVGVVAGITAPAPDLAAPDRGTREPLGYINQLTQSGTVSPVPIAAVSTQNPAAPIGRVIQFGKYDWLVLGYNRGLTMVISKDILQSNTPYNTEQTNVTWESCSLRKWLNNEFYGTFTQEERAKIITAANRNPDNKWKGTSGGADTRDFIFVMCVNEVVKYFGDSGDWMANRKKDYNGQLNNNYSVLHDQFNAARIAKYNGNEAWWWLRTPGRNAGMAVCVASDGSIDLSGTRVKSAGSSGGVRPSLWLNI
jgi:hypothetical protein